MSEKLVQLIAIGDVIHQTGLSRSMIYALMAEGKFPKSVAIGPQARRFVQHEVSAFIAAKIAERDRARTSQKKGARS